MKHFLAFDLGASSGRAIMGDFDGNTIALEELHRFANGPHEVDGHLYWDIHTLFAEIREGLRKALATGKPIDGIGIDTWGVDLCYLGADGKLIGLPHHYRDPRTDDIMPWTFQRISREEVYQETGIQFMNLNTIFQLSASLRDGEEALQQADKLLFIPNALTYLLCGKVAAEYSIATTSQLFNPHTGDWSWKIIDALGLKRSLFPQILPACTVAAPLSPELQEEFHCGPIPVILIGSHDTASAVAAVPAGGERNWAYLSSGTWSLMGVERKTPRTDAQALAANYTNEGGVGNTIRFLKNIMGLWIIQESRRQWKREGKDYSFAQMEAWAKEAAPFQSFINPDDASFNTPGNMPEKIREFCRKTGQHVPETTGEVVRCIYESLALKYRHTVENIQNLRGKKATMINVVGGGTKDHFLSQMTADACGLEVSAGPEEATSIGNLLAQMMAVGAIKDLSEARQVVANSFEVKHYTPCAYRGAWDEAYGRFVKLL